MAVPCFSVRKSVLLIAAIIFTALALRGAESDINANTSAGAVDDAANAIRRFRAAPGMKIDLFASEPMLRNVVSFAFDEQGRCYVVESNRRRTSVFDIRGLSEWLDADFSFRTVGDRAKFFRNALSATNPNLPDFLKAKRNLLSDFNRDGTVDWRDLEVQSERIRLLVDTNADGRADTAATLAEGFDGITSGVAAGVLARKGDVWFTCIPDLWRISNGELRRTKGMPSAESLPANPHRANHQSTITNLLSGFGVHIAFGGHDMHGLKMGPDGKIYFSIADRGTGTNLWDRIVDKWPGLTMEALADSGGVFRCHPDGTELEVICIGLRNPQELAFDDHGNLFTGENNGDGGDKARWIHVVEGADYGWRLGWQWLPRMGAWNSEMLWGMAGTNTSAYYLPPVAHIGAGPAGVAYYPGTGLPARYDRHFFMCDFRGGPNSVVRSFALRPKGASFEAFDETEFLTGPLCTDVDFGVDGAVYVSDWVKGWDKTDQGRIYRVFDPNMVNDPAVLEVKKLLGGGMETRSSEELARLLGHRDMRVRLEAQWELVERSVTNLAAFGQLNAPFRERTNLIARLHTLWGWGQISERALTTTNRILRLRAMSSQLHMQNLLHNLRDGYPDSDRLLRAHAGMLLGKVHRSGSGSVELMQNKDPQVRLLALQGLSRSIVTVQPSERQRFVRRIHEPLIEVLRQNSNQDAYLRHAAVLALARIGNVPALLAAAKDESPAVRLGVCLALRRLQRPEITQFLRDSDPQIVLEAARAIHDTPIPAAMNALASVPVVSRRESARAPGRMPGALSGREPIGMAAALSRRVLNAHFRLGAETNAQALAEFAASDAPEALRSEALELLALWARPPGRDRVVGLWRPLPARDGTIAAMALQAVLPQIESSAPSVVKLAAKKALTDLGVQPGEASAGSGDPDQLTRLSTALENGSLKEKQDALTALSGIDDAAAAKLLGAWLDKLVAGGVAKELRLDVTEAVTRARLVSSASTTEKLARIEADRDGKDLLSKWRDCLYGGDASEGKRTFVERQDAACFRCHKINGEGGEVGPEMAGLGRRMTREAILESILLPNKAIAPGFENVLVTLKDGTSYAGLLKSESDLELTINSAEDGLITVKKADVQARDRGLSSMPEELGAILSKRDVRNLVEFLSTLK